MHAAQQEVALRARSQILLAAHAQRSLRDPDRLADLQDIEWFSRVLLNRLAEAMHDNCMLRLRQALPVILAGTEAVDHVFDQGLLEPVRGLGIGDDCRSILCQLSGRSAEPLE